MGQTFKYLDINGLQNYHNLLLNYINENIINDINSDLTDLWDWTNEVTPKIEASEAAWTAFLTGLDSQTPAPTLAQIKEAINTTLPAAIAKAQTDAVSAANAHTATRETAITNAYKAADTALHNTITGEIATAKSGAEATAKGYTDEKVTAITTAYEAADKALETSLKSYADQAEADAKTYADGLNTTMDGRVKDLEDYKTTLNNTTIPGLNTAISNAEKAAKDHADTEIGKLNATTLKMSGEANAATIASEITDLKGSISGGTFFKGVKESLPSNGDDYKNGDIIIVGDLEYIWDDAQNKWIELGNSSANAQAITNLGTRISNITITGDEDNTYVDVKATKSGDNWTLTVDESELSAKIANLEKADTDNLADAKKHATDLVEALDATFELDATGASADEVSVVTGVNLTQVDGKITTFTVDSGKAATKTYVDNQITDAKKHATDLVAGLDWKITGEITEDDNNDVKSFNVIITFEVMDGKLKENSVKFATFEKITYKEIYDVVFPTPV